ncbi:nitrogenase molybdenum-iron protein beta chain [Alkaliphilus metalliredigens QYMF]|uniref:Nitrogenase molybdenum-iron protein beta chain n=1 Tax=Alkaliphilus metalliredigens (strain QYMF) TaxID=293826 RepID=A6TTX9_ALKMQ|nr:nitrogenase molybdenum-iron protein subunit beta [Alkaliphilus metalliredigens]ABR49647.1 nitrogenase molybdenum-iron protein beta chain [Alkaliphilus metalliredigens QYMF]
MLDHTSKEISERKALVINPAKTCQPIGAMYAALGIHNCLPHSHGSQGCCSFHRMHLTRHFRDPIVASTSSFTEGASVFGGSANLKTSIKNVFSVYKPDVIAINTTCLSETIGDDLPSTISDSEIPEGKHVFHANTPSYAGSHVTGFSNMVKAMVTHFSEGTGDGSNNKVNLIPGYTEPGDMREIKRIAKLLDIPNILFPDTSGVVDSPMTGKYNMYPKGGTKVVELIDTGSSMATVALGKFASEAAANELEKKCKVASHPLNLPIGVKATDEFIMELVKITGKDVPDELEEERGMLVDIMTDTHHHYHGKRVAIFGDPDHVMALTEFTLSLGMKPVYVVTGTPGKAFEKEVNGMLESSNVEGRVKASGDLFELHQWVKNEPVDLLIGNTYGKYIARAEDIPLVRFGFPNMDRSIHSYFPVVGYKGAMRLMEMIGNALLERVDRDALDEDFELVL